MASGLRPPAWIEGQRGHKRGVRTQAALVSALALDPGRDAPPCAAADSAIPAPLRSLRLFCVANETTIPNSGCCTRWVQVRVKSVSSTRRSQLP